MNDLLKTILLRLKSGQITEAQALEAIRALRSGETPANQPELLFYRQIWEEAEVQAPQTPFKRPTFWIGEDAGAGDLEGDGPGVFHLRPGAEYQRVGEREFSLGKDFRAGLRKVLAATGIPARIWFHWSDVTESVDIERLLQLSQELIAAGLAESVRILCYTRGEPTPRFRACAGFARTLAVEQPLLQIRIVWAEGGGDLRRGLRSEMDDATGPEVEVHYRDGRRFVRRFQAVDAAAVDERAVWKVAGRYLITGGAGGIGLQLARYLCSAYQARVILAGRSELNPDRTKSLETVMSVGGTVVYARADVSRRDEVERLVAEARGFFGGLDGVVHAAGITRDAYLINKTEADLRAVIAPKVSGTIHLDEVLGAEPLDFFATFSSLAAVLGNPGQSDYAYANCWMDALLAEREQRRRRGERSGRSVSINWPLWAEGGMDVSEERKAALASGFGLYPMPVEAGWRALEMALRGVESNCCVLYGVRSRVESWLSLSRSTSAAAASARGALDQASIAQDSWRPPPEDRTANSDPECPCEAGLPAPEKLPALTLDWLTRVYAEVGKFAFEGLDPDERLERYGIDSILINRLTQRLEEALGPVSKTLFFERQTMRAVANQLAGAYPDALRRVLRTPTADVGLKAQRAVAPAAVPAALSTDRWNDEIAIVGLSGRYPGADDVDAFWENLKSGVESIVEVPAERWDWRDYFDPAIDAGDRGKSYGKWGGFVSHADCFDSLFFRIAPREAEAMDPQERLFLETAWATLEDAGYTPAGLNASAARVGKGVGVFVGVTKMSYLLHGPGQWAAGNPVIPNSLSWSVANRVSYLLDFSGPSLPIDTACSASLTAIHEACESIRRGECAAALAGGVNLYLHPSTFVGLCQMRMLATDGKTRSFGGGGNGFVPGEGVGAVLLKPLSAALADGDHVYGVIKGSALNHGGHTNGYSVPNPNAQAALIQTALVRAGVQPRDVGYVEAHGTGTALGDPVEIAGLTTAFRSGTADCDFCAIGSVKSNIGHLEAAAGIAALTKTLLQMQHGRLVPSLHADPPNSRIDFASTPFRVQRGLAEWPRHGAKAHLAGVSSFGAGGANAHLVLASWEPALDVAESGSTRPELIVLSARTLDRLAEVVKRLADSLRAGGAEATPRRLRDIAHTLRVGREAMEERLAFVVSNRDELILRLDEILSGGSTEIAGIFRGRKAGRKETFDPRGKELPEIAAAWAGGADVDWSAFDAGSLARRVSLPTYPFVRERHWIATFPGKAAESLHPLLDRNASTLEEQRFLKFLRPDDLLVREHVVRGAKLLPAAACLEMARAAGDASREDATVTSISRVVWSRPIRVDEAPLALGVSLSPERDRVRFEIWSEAGDSRVPHVQGQLGFAASRARPDPLNLAEAQARMPVIRDRASIYEMCRSFGLQYGPAFQALEWVRSNGREVLASIRLPEAGAALAGSCKLNPLVLDAAFQSVIGFGWGGVGSAALGPVLPFEADEITFFGSLPEVCQVLVTEISSEPAAVRAYDLTLAANDGSVLALVKGFKVKPAIGTGAGQDRPTVRPPAAASTPAEPLLALLQARLKQIIAAQLKVDADDVEANENFGAYGFDSISLTNFSNQLNLQFGIETTPALFFERPTVVRLAQFLLERFGDPMRRALGEAAAEPTQAEPGPRQIPKPARFSAGTGRVADSRTKPGDPIAVIGMDGRFPGAPSLDEFWANLDAGVHSVSEVPADRWDWHQHNPAARWGGFLADVDKFDAAFFGISPREAELMDPQQRLFLEVVWNTLENAGYLRDPLKPEKIGLFVGVATRDYAELVARLQRMEAHTATGLSHSILANRVSYLLNLTGPSEAIDTACSSSLVALHRAVASLRAGECSLAVAGGVNAVLTPATTLGFVEAGMLCADGRCRTFDAEASGYVRGEGVGAVLLKRLEDAVRAGDMIYGVVRGTAVNHGGRVNSLTAPNPNAQAEVIREALADAQISPDAVGYIETHGTGTPLGDPVEVNGLKMVFKERGAGVPVPRCGLGSVKTNVGHLESAAGIAGVIKVLLALRHGRIPASLHFGRLNPYIQLEGSPFYIAKETHAWPRPGADVPRCAGVSSFGFGGANAHVVIEEFVAPIAAPDAAGYHLVTISAKTDQALAKRISDLADWLASRPEAVSLGRLAFTLNCGRWHMPKRCAVLTRSLDELSETLRSLASDQRPANGLVGTGGRLSPEDEATCRRVWDELTKDFTSGAPSDRTSDAWRAKLWSVAEIYVKGFEVDWRIVYAGTVNKIALPGYPFLRERHWIPEPLSAAQPIESRGLAARIEHTAGSVACFTEDWQARPIASSPSPHPRPRVLVIGGDEPLREALRREMSIEQLIALDWGSGAGDIPNDSSFSDVVLCLPTDPVGEAAAHVGALLAWARALLVLRGSKRVKLMVWENADVPSPVLAASAALLRSLRLECPEFNVSAVCRKGVSAAETARWIGLELAAGESSGVEVHYRQGVRLVRCVVPCAPPGGSERAGIREGGVYLVTGGAGRLGMAVAVWLAGAARVRVALTGRSPSGEHTQECLRKLRDLGSEAEYFRLDVTSRESVAAVVARIEESWGELNGVVHAAGVLRDGLLAARTADQEREVLAPKILGAMNLDLATRDSDLDWFVCFSSLTAALGNIGQTAYAAANGFLDGFARWREGLRSAGERRGAAISIDWPFWRDGGMRLGENAADQAAQENWLKTNLGLEALRTEDGLKVLGSVLASGPSPVIVAPGDPVRIRGVLDRAFGLVSDATPSVGRHPAVSADTAEKLLRELKSEAAEILKLSEAEIDAEANLTGLGFDSILLKAFAVRLSQKYAVELTPNAFFTHTHLNAVRDLLLGLAPGKFGVESAASEPPKPTAAVTARSAARERAPQPGSSTRLGDPVVVVGMSGRFPGSPNLDAFWRNLVGGVDSISEIPAERFELRGSSDGGTASGSTPAFRWGGFIADVDKFDAAFFGISPREAELMDPQHRLLLEEAWRAVESSGESPARLAGRTVGVFVGIQYHDYQDLLAEAGAAHAYCATGNGHAMAANRISHCLDLRGPSEAVDTACSSSLIALHRAVSLLQQGACESALVAGVSLMLSPRAFVGTSQIGVLSPDGRCKTFDAAANGYVRGEGVGVLYVMRLSEAERRRLPIQAVIRGVGVNHGGRGQSLTAPNARSQAELLAKVYRTAGVDAATIGYIEAHGTGTELGDPIEFDGLKDAFARTARSGAVEARGYCGLGSVKTNIGHLEAAAGVAGVIKVILALRNKILPASLHLSRVNPFIKLEDSPFFIVDRTREWAPLRDAVGNALPRRAGVSSFGFGGANAHVLLEEFDAPQPDQLLDAGVWRLATLSARSEPALRAKIQDLVLWLEAEGSRFRWDDIVATLNEGRPEFEWRLAAVARSAAELREVLQAQLEVGSSKQAVHGRKASGGAEPVLVELLKHVQERLGSPDLPADDRREKLLALGDLFVKGYFVDWEIIPKPVDWRRVSLPVSPFESRRFWVPSGTGASPLAGTPGTSGTKPAEPILFVPRWKLVTPPGRETTDAARDSGAAWIVHSAESLDAARRLAEIGRPRDFSLLDISDRGGIEAFLRDHARPRPGRIYFLSRHPSAEGLQGLLWLMQALSGCGIAARPLEFCLATLSGSAADAGLTPTAAALHALARTAAIENPGWRVGLFDVDSEASLEEIEAFGPTTGRSVLIRFGRFLLQELVPVAESVGFADPFKKSGTYFFAGGAGGVGLHVSLYLAERYQANLVWTGRRCHDAAIQEKIERIEKAGGRVVYFQADITDAVALAAAAGQARDRFGAINGVLHSAISLQDGLINRMAGEAFAAGLGTHLRGSENLAAVFAGDALDFLVFFSTSAVFAAREGIASYVTGSAYKDAWALALSGQRNYPVRVVNWGYWGQLGLGAIDGLSEGFERLGIRALTIQEAMRAVSLAITSTTPQLVCVRAGGEVLRSMGVNLGEKAQLSETVQARSAKLLQAVEAEPPPLLDVAGVERFVAAFGRLDRFGGRLLVDALRRTGVSWRAGVSLEPESLRRTLGVTEDYSRLFGSLLRLLLDHGYVAGDERRLTVTELGGGEGTHLEDAALEEEAQGILRESPDIAPYLALIRACVTALPEVLTGRRHHMEVMFPNGSSRLVQGIYSENPLINFHHRRIAAAVRSVLSRALDGNGARKFRVIEAGAGTGGLTRVILAAVGDLRTRFEYVFTDVSKSFVDQAKTEFGSADGAVDFRLLDLEREPEEQGFERQAADAVVCSNVLHAVRDVGSALRHLKQLLRPGGLILVHEAMARQDFSTLTFGLTSGWWHFEDDSLRIPASPLLAARTWLAQCLAAGFRGARVLGLPGEPDAACAEGVVFAESDGVIISAERSTSEAAGQSAPAASSRSGREAAPTGPRAGEVPVAEAREYVRQVLATVLKLPQDSIEDEVTFDVYGVDSLIIMELRGQFEKDLGQVPTSLLFSKFTVARLADHFLAHYRERLPGVKGVVAAPVTTGSAGQRTERAVAVTEDRQVIAGDGGVRGEDIAVVGLSGSYPGAPGLAEFWRNLETGKSSITEIPPSRWDWRAYFDPDPDEAANGRCYCKWGGFVADHDKFDPLFFGISPREAEVTDPQERLFLQTAWAAIEDAGYTPRGLRESAAEAGGSVGVFVGVTKNSYQLNGPDEWAKGNPVVANSLPWSIANRVSYQFDFHGPSMPVDTACSSSLTAFHAACESIRGGDCAVAVVGGVNLYLHPSTFVALCHQRMLSPDGICRSYGEGANGFVPGEGVGAAILKPLSRALADGDHIYGVIKGTSVNHGGRTNGYTVPNPSAQAALIRRALDRAGVSARSISYIEGHGTGTSLGDPIEVEGLSEAFRADTDEVGFCRIGSLKTNLGHLESAAGIAAVTKTLLQMTHRRLVPSLHADQLNPHIEFEPGPFRVQRCLEEWRPAVEGEGATAKQHPRRAGVSSFGAGGANAHVIFEEAPERAPSETATESRPRLIVLSARTEEQLRTYAERLVSRLESGDPDVDLAAVAFTLQVGREPQDERLALIASSLEEAAAKLRAFLDGAQPRDGWWQGRASRPSDALRILMDGDDGGGLMRRMLEAGELEKCARLWVAGVPLEWLRLYPSGRPKRVSLPTYPFKKERYWIPEEAVSDRAPAEASPVPAARRWASFRPVWRSVPLAAGAGSSESTDLVVVTQNGTWFRELKNCGCFQNVIWVRPGAVFADPGSGEFELRMDAPEDFDRLCLKLQERDLARRFVWLPPARESENLGADLDRALTEELLGPHLLIQALLRYDAQVSPRFIFATVRDGGGTDPLHGLMAGYVKALRLEHPSVDARWLSLGQVEGGALGRILAAEMRAAPTVGTEVRYDGSTRMVREMEICPTTVGSEQVLLPGGRYLITGGAGGLGMIFAEHLVTTFKARLILVGRSALSPENQARLDQLTVLGGEVRYVRGDVADRDQTLAMVREVSAAFGGLDGVIHAAGVLEYGRLAVRESAAMRRVLAAKVHGTVWLDEATSDLKLDFFAVFSSLAAVVGVSEACDYAAGNAFLDHFAAWREEQRAAGKRQGKSVAINWPHWRDGGMKFGDPAVAANWELWARRVQGLKLLARASGIEAFVEALRGSEPQRCVVEGDLTKAAAMLRRAPGAVAVDATNSTVTKRDWRDGLEADLISLVGELLKVKPEDVDFEANLSELGFDSITLKALADRVNRLLGLALMPSLFFSHPTLSAFKKHLIQEYESAVRARYEGAGANASPVVTEPVRKARRGEANVASAELPVRDEVVAVVGMSGVFPGSPTLDQFWRHLEKGDDLIREVPGDRASWREIGQSSPATKKPSRWGGFIDGVDAFDAAFFGIPAIEAERMDPQHRLFLQETWRAIESAGESPAALSGRRVGVFAGVQFRDYEGMLARLGIADAYTATGNGHALLANRVSFLLNLRGPSEAVDTACSSSLVALNRAVVALLGGECDAAVAGGVSLLLTPETSIGAGHLSLLAPDGRCKTFDASANGYVKGEGVGVLYLMRLSDALAGGYPVRGIVRGSAVNHGGRAQSLTAPNGQAQRDLLIEVYTRARVAPETVGMIEVHGTGTELGDPVEVTGLKEAFTALAAQFGSPPAGEPSCGLASVKSNIGHLEPAAGIAGVIKVLLALRHRVLPPTLHVRKLNPYIDLTGTRFYVLTQARPWAAIQSRDGRELPRRAGVSSFGFGGANAHVILEEFCGPEPTPALPGPRVIVLSAKTKTAFDRKVSDLRAWLEHRAEPDDLAALSFTLALGRSHFNERAALVADSVSDLRRKLDQLEQGKIGDDIWRGVAGRVKEAEQRDWEAKRRALPDALETLRETARGYVAGYEPDWARLFEPAARRRLELPGYPLAPDRFWISSTPASPVARRPSGAELPPLFDRVEMTSARCRFHKTIRADEFYVQDHVVNGVKTVPGVAYLELARAAVAAWNGLGEVAALRHVVWAQPIQVREPSITIIIELVRQKSGDVAFEVRTDAPAGPILHAQGKIGFSVPTSNPPERFDLDAFEKTCALRLDHEQIYRAFERVGLGYGPSFRALDWLKAGPAGAVGRLRLSPVLAAAPDRSRQMIHPSLMDAVLQTVLGLHALEPNRETVLSVPFGLDEVVILGPLPDTCLAVCSPPTRSHSQAPPKHDFRIYSEAGELVCAIHGFMTRELRAPTAPSVASGNHTRFYLPTWTPVSAPERVTPNADAIVLVLDDDHARFATVRERIHARSPGVRVVQVRTGAAFQADGVGAFVMRPGATEDGVRLVKSVLGDGSRNLYLLQLWPLATPADADVGDWPEGLPTGVFAAFSLAQALQKCGVHSVQWVHACREDGAAAAGFFKCLIQENGRYRGRVVEIGNVSDEGLAARLLDELFAADLAQEVRRDGSGRFVKTLVPFAPATKASPPAQPPVYLISGGLGELGRRVAEHLARSTAARLVLLGRSPLAADGESFLEQLRVWGGEGMYVQADVTVSPEVKRAVRMALERFGGLDGVIHAAGIIRDALVLKKSLEDFKAVLRVKVLGAVNLDHATQALPLQHFVLFSSVSSVLGNLGQADYAAANGFLDSFARQRETRRSAGERQGMSVSINWPIWSEGGMSVDAQTERWLQNRLGMRPLPTSAGLDALDAAMASPEPQCVVLYGDPVKLDQALLGSAAKAPVASAEASGVPAGSAAERQAMSSMLAGVFAEFLRVPPSDIDIEATFDDFGVDSIMMITIMNELEKRLGRTLPPSVLADHPTVSALAGYLAGSAPVPVVTIPQGSPVLNALATTGGEGSVSVCSVPQDRRVAVVGMSCRFPQSPSVQAYWENLEAGRDLVRALPDWRWDVAASFSADKSAPLKSYVKSGGIVDGIDLFDAAYFGISDRDALGLDPQHRLLLELARELFDHAGYPDAEIRGRRVGVIIGATEGRYLLANLKHLAADQAGRMVVNTGQNMMAARIADFFDLKGPAKTVDTACSSSMMAVHDACQALLSGDIEMAVAGGVHLLVDESDFVGFSKARVLSDDGCCRVFDERANGFVLGEGAGLVLLKPYQAAVAAQDRILATILASAANNDGHTLGLTVPSLEGQREVMETALARSGVDPATVSYLEAHGTGTLLGDPIEIKAAASVYGRGAARLQHCAVASVKSNMGHLMHAAGIASLIKLVLSLQRGVKPPTLHCLKPHPRFRFAESPFYPIIRAEPWETGDGPRRGAVSSFGFGGTNVHAILQEHPAAGGERRPLPPTRFQRKRYWLGREIVAVGPEPAGFDRDRAVALLRRLKSGAISRGDVLKELQL